MWVAAGEMGQWFGVCTVLPEDHSSHHPHRGVGGLTATANSYSGECDVLPQPGGALYPHAQPIPRHRNTDD